MSVKKKIAVNTISNYTGYFIKLAVNFFLFPFVVHHLGAAQSGLWFLLSSITSYMGFLDVGIKPTLIKHVAHHHAKNNRQGINEVVNAAFFIYLIIGIAAALAMIVISYFFPQIFHIAPELIFKAKICTYIVALALFLSFPLSAIGAGTLNGLQRYDKTRTSAVFSSLSGSLIVILLLSKGYGVIAVTLADQTTNLLSWLLNVYFAKRIAPYLTISLRFLKKAVIKEIFRFSVVIFVINMASRVIYYADRIVIGIFLNVSSIVFYEAAFKIYHTITQIPLLLLSAIMPASSELSARNRPSDLKKLYLYSTKYTIAFFLALVIPVLIFTRAILKIWVGPDYMSAAIYTQLFLLYVFFTLNHSSAVQILTGIGKVRTIMRYQVTVAIENLVLSIILAKIFGLIGVILGTTIPFIIMEWFYIKTTFKILGVNWKEYLRKVILKPYLCAFLPAILLLILHHFFDPARLWEIAAILVGGVILYALIFYFLGLSSEEKTEFKIIFKGKLLPKKN